MDEMSELDKEKVRDEVLTDTDCSICTEDFTDPRHLPCMHSFCLRCLEQYCRESNPGDVLHCPLCRADFTVPPGGPSDLPANSFINKLLELKKPFQCEEAPSVAPQCDYCTNIEEKCAAPLYCIECGKNLCERCRKVHDGFESSRSHDVVSQEKKPNPEDLRRREVIHCIDHPAQLISIVCVQCNEPICYECYAKIHMTHGDFSDLGNSAEKLRQDFTGYIERTIAKVQEARAALLTLNDNEVKFERKLEELCDSVKAESDRLHAMFERSKEKLLEEIRMHKVWQLNGVKSKADALETQVTILEAFVTCCRQLKDSAPAHVK